MARAWQQAGGCTLIAAETILNAALRHLEVLIAFETVSSKSNMALLEYAAARLPSAQPDWVLAQDGKGSLVLRLGPARAGGILLSGHSDVVPVDGQSWTSDPWRLSGPRDGRLYGRGTSDMKSFIALALALGEIVDAPLLSAPIMIALSHDEEVGCLGAPALVAAIVARQPPPSAVIVGEPTGMKLVTAHKGVLIFRVTVRGHEAHSSLVDHGVSAIMEAIPILAELHGLSVRLAAGMTDNGAPRVPTLTIGKIDGGTAANILARECTFLCDLRAPFPGAPLLDPIVEFVAAANRRLAATFADAGATIEYLCDVPALQSDPDGAAAALVRSLIRDNSPGRAVAYGAEAGIFQGAGFSTVVCGPGSIEQAHQPDEFIELSQVREGACFMARLTSLLTS